MPRQHIDQWPYGRQQRVGTRPPAPAYGRPAANPFVRPPGRPVQPSASSRLLMVAFVAAAVLILGGCLTGIAMAAVSRQSPAPATADVIADAGGVGGVSAFGLPFATGTRISIVQGPHAANFGSVPGRTSTIWLAGQGTVPASLDLKAPEGAAVLPVASGRVLSAWPQCHVVVIDHGGGVWAEYVHVRVSVSTGDNVSRGTVLGYVLGRYDKQPAPCYDYSGGAHLHLAFASGSGTSGSYVGIAGQVLCGHAVNNNGDIVGLGTLNGGDFTVPNCDATGPAPVTPKPVTPKPVTPQPVTPAPVTPPASTPPPATVVSSCGVPSLASPGSSQSFASSQDVTLSWNTTCSQTYAELTGAPYGTLSFGGWQSGRSVHIGQMWPGTYAWHVKGRSSTGQETGWSDTRSFTIASSAGPVVTDPPAPIVTNPPAPVVTSPPAPIVTKGPCPFMNGGNGVTFYSGPNFTGQSWTWYVPAGNGDAYADLPAGLFRNLGSFYVSNNAWHVVLYQGENGTGNLGHYDASWANVDSYWHNTESVKIYINRTNC
jgi:murein DD-endopeptidase MepM/ murein hydrolase activator NlpD